MTSENLKEIKLVAFDFDGVFVLDSDAIFKKEAWGIALSPWQGRYEPILKEAQDLFGSGKPGGRAEIMHYIFEHLGEPAENISMLVKKSAKTFDDYVQAKILDARLVPGALEMLETCSKCGIIMYLNSGTATSALQRSAQSLKIAQYFSDILGSTKEPNGGSKLENLQYISKREQLKAENMLFVGDGESDYQAAQKFGCSFIGIANKWNQWAGKEKPFSLVIKLEDVPKFLESANIK